MPTQTREQAESDLATGMSTIGPLFVIGTAYPEGCNRCGCILFLDERAAFVDGKVTCEPCVKAIKSKDPLFSKAASKRQPRRP